jgi:predicted dehydrogenase
MYQLHKMKIVIIGTGQMAICYAKVLQAMGRDFTVVGRGQSSCSKFASATGVIPISGGLEKQQNIDYSNSVAIVAVGIENLADIAINLINYGCNKMLLEKPGAMSLIQIETLKNLAKEKRVEIAIGYNRRFHDSTLKAIEIIAKDGGAQTVHFEFTEFANEVSKLPFTPEIKKIWLIANSSHVIDLALHLSGRPTELASWSAGKMEWHPAASRFVGAGITEKGTLVSYSSNWSSIGRWGVEITTNQHRLLLKPLEKLKVMDSSTFEFEELENESIHDIDFKPGLYKQVQHFLLGNTTLLCSLDEQADNWKLYKKIAGY